MNQSSNAHPEFRFGVINAMTAYNADAGFGGFICRAKQDLFEHFERKPLNRESDNIERKQRFCTHGVDITQRICGSYGSKIIRIINNRSEEVECLNNCLIRINQIYRSVVTRCISHQHIGIGCNREFFQDIFQVGGLHLAGTS